VALTPNGHLTGGEQANSATDKQPHRSTPVSSMRGMACSDKLISDCEAEVNALESWKPS
jgi:hypothetical protein